MRALVLVLVTVGSVGCAAQLVGVPDSEWKTVPATERAQIDRDHAAAVSAAQREQEVARIALADARKSAPQVVTTAPVTAAPGDDWATSLQAWDAKKRGALNEVAAATIGWQRARVAFYEQRIVLASSKLAVLQCAYEVTRARAVDRNRLGWDDYDSAEFRGQLAQAQERWHAADTLANANRDELTNAAARLASAKEAYALIVRSGPTAPSSARDLRLGDWRDKPLRTQTRWRARSNAGYLKLDNRLAHK